MQEEIENKEKSGKKKGKNLGSENDVFGAAFHKDISPSLWIKQFAREQRAKLRVGKIRTIN
jgi:hypothetical protein